MRQLGCAILCLALILCLSGCACKHEWAEATCTEPKTCTKCGETEGDPLEHTPGEWVQDEPDYVTGLVWLRQYCSVCGKELDTDLKSLTSFHNGDTFLFTPQQFVDRLNSIFSVLTKNYSFLVRTLPNYSHPIRLHWVVSLLTAQVILSAQFCFKTKMLKRYLKKIAI